MTLDKISYIDLTEDFTDNVTNINTIIAEDKIHNELGVNTNDIPRHRATVIHTKPLLMDRDRIIRIECRVGENQMVGERFDISSLVNNKYFIRKEMQDDSTYFDFYFELPNSITKAVDEFQDKIK